MATYVIHNIIFGTVHNSPVVWLYFDPEETYLARIGKRTVLTANGDWSITSLRPHSLPTTLRPASHWEVLMLSGSV